MDDLLQDLRGALRFVARNPAFAAVAVLTLGIGIGANTAIFSVLYAVLLRPLPFEAPDRLVTVQQQAAEHGTIFEFSYLDFRDIQEAARSFESLGAVGNPRRFAHDVEDETWPVWGGPVTGDMFEVLGVGALLGRTLEHDDGLDSAARVVVLGYSLWRQRFGGDPAVLGTPIRLSGRDYTVVGVMPPEFEYPQHAELWVPVEQVARQWVGDRGIGFLDLVGRLGQDVTAAEAGEEVSAIIQQIRTGDEGPFGRATAVVEPLRNELVGDARPALLLLLSGAGLVLLIACANVASMLLAKGATRRREIVVRAALGASRRRLLRQLLAESLVLAGGGAAVGVALCALAMEPLVRLSPVDLYRGESIAIVPEVLAFTAILSVVTAVAFGIVPALRDRSAGAAGALSAGAGRVTSGRDDRRLVHGLVMAEVALAFALLVAAGLLARSLGQLQAVDLGFEREGRVTLDMFVPRGDDPGPDRNFAFFEQLTPRLEALPGVASAAGVLLRALDGPDGYDATFTVEGQTEEEHTRNPFMHFQGVTPGYFRTMGISLLAGRDFDHRDDADAPRVVIVSRALAERFWPGEDPVGRRMKLGAPDSPAPWMTVVGVTGAVRYRALEEPSMTAYLPHRQAGLPLNHLVVRTHGETAAVVSLVRDEIRALDSGARAVEATTVSELVDGFLAQPRFQTALLGLFGVLALLLGAVGTYGVLAFAVSRRRREFAVRLAVGARGRTLLGDVLRQAGLLVAAGLGIGLVGTLVAARILEGMLFGVSAREPAIYGGVAALLLVTGILAAFIPALRAARSDPMETLRQE